MKNIISKTAGFLGSVVSGKGGGAQPGLPHPYENLSGVAPAKAVARAREELRDGWSHRGRYQAIAHGAQWPWFDDMDENSGRNFHLHAWDMVNELLLAHRHSGEAEFYHAAAAVASDWIERFPVWTEDSGAYYAWYDMAVGLRAQRLAYLLDAGSRLEMIDPATAAKYAASLVEHARYLEVDDNIIFHNNHGFYQVVGQLAMGRRFAGKLPKMRTARTQAKARLRRMIDAQFTDEGVHREHSPDYHRMVYLSLRGVLAEGLIDDEGLAGLIRRIEEALAWFVLPDGTLARFGDSDERKLVYKVDDARRLWMTDAMRWITSRGKLGEPPEVACRGFKDSGYFVARDRWPVSGEDFAGRGYLAQICGFHSRAHKHADDLSVIWYEHGVPLLVDAGRYGYLGKAEAGSDLWKDGYWYSHPSRVYVETTRAHNTVEIDGRNHPRKDAGAYGSALRRHGSGSGGVLYAETEVRHGDVRFIRVLAWLPGKWLLVYDWLRDAKGQGHKFRQWFHFPSGSVPRPSKGAMGEYVEIPGLPMPLHVVDLQAPEQPMEWVHGQYDAGGNPFQGFHSPAEKILEPNWALGAGRGGSQATYATLLSLGDVDLSSVNVRTSPSGTALRMAWTADGQQYDLSINRQAEGEHPVSLSTPGNG